MSSLSHENSFVFLPPSRLIFIQASTPKYLLITSTYGWMNKSTCMWDTGSVCCCDIVDTCVYYECVNLLYDLILFLFFAMVRCESYIWRSFLCNIHIFLHNRQWQMRQFNIQKKAILNVFYTFINSQKLRQFLGMCWLLRKIRSDFEVLHMMS